MDGILRMSKAAAAVNDRRYPNKDQPMKKPLSHKYTGKEKLLINLSVFLYVKELII